MGIAWKKPMNWKRYPVPNCPQQIPNGIFYSINQSHYRLGEALRITGG